MRRRRLLILVVGVLALLVLWGWFLLRPKPRASKVKFDRIQEGMTMREVSTVMCPVEEKEEEWMWKFPTTKTVVKDGIFSHLWVANDATITVAYRISDEPRVVVSKTYEERPPESFRERLRRWLPWCERAFGRAASAAR